MNRSRLNYVGLKNRTGFYDILIYAVLAFIAALTLYPMLYVLFVSLSPITEVMKGGFIFFPRRITFEAYGYAFTQSGIMKSYGITVYITVLGTLINLVLTTMGAYVMSKKDLPGARYISTFIIVTLIFGGGLIPFYMVVKSLGMIDKLWALMIPNAISPFYMIIMRNFIMSIHDSIKESARIDGCSEYRILWNIVVPLSTSSLATIGLFYAVMHWNTYFQAIIFLNDSDLMPLQVIVRNMFVSATDTMHFENAPPPVETIRNATIILVLFPILCVYPFLQKYFVKGIMLGAVKG